MSRVFKVDYIPDPDRGRPLWNAKIFVGVANQDPTIPSNQIQLTGDIGFPVGQSIPVPQPVRTNAGGITVYNNSPLDLNAPGQEYAIQIFDRDDNLIYNFPQVDGSVVMNTTSQEEVTGLTIWPEVGEAVIGQTIPAGTDAIRYPFNGRSTLFTIKPPVAVTGLITNITINSSGVGELEVDNSDVYDLAEFNSFIAANDGDSQLAGGNIWPLSSQESAQVGDDLTGYEFVRLVGGDFSEITLFPIVKKDGTGDLPSGTLDSSNLTSRPYDCVIGGESFWILDINYSQKVFPDFSFKSFWAVGDNVTNDFQSMDAAFSMGRSVFIEEGTYYTESTILTYAEGQKVYSNNNIGTYIRGESSVNPIIGVRHWWCELNRVYALNGDVGIQVGTDLIKCNFVVLNDCHTKGSTSTGLKVSNGNVGQIRGGMYENSDINVHFTDESVDTNGWGLYNPRAFGGRVNYWFQGDVDGNFVDDNFITLTSEAYTETGVILRGRRNVCFIYAESANPGTFAIKNESASRNYVVLTGNADQDPSGDPIHGLVQGVSPVYQVGSERLLGEQSSIDISLSSRTHQILGFRNNAEIINTSGSGSTILIQRLDLREKNNPFYLTLPASNNGTTTVSLDDPGGYTFTDGSTTRSYKAQGEDIYVELQKVDDFVYAINVLNSERQPAGSDTINLTATTSFFLSNYREDDQMIELVNASGSTQLLNIREGDVMPLGYEITFYATGANNVTLGLQDGMTYIDGTTTKSLTQNNAYKFQKITDTVFAVYQSI